MPNFSFQVEEYVLNAYTSSAHPVGTAAMLPREKGGVVDTTLKVYGTTNIRVVDASVIPLHVSTHPQATIYVSDDNDYGSPYAHPNF